MTLATAVPAATDDSTQSPLLAQWRLIAARLPNQPALTSAGVGFTFAEADRLSDLAALDLVDALGDGDEPVGILSEHTAHALLAILTVLKSGRTHVFLDPHVPVERLGYYTRASGLKVCLVSTNQAEIGADIATSLPFDEIVARAVASTLSETDLADAVEERLAAGRDRQGSDGVSIVFTSGSSGLPKGVLQTEDTLRQQVGYHRQLVGVGPGDRALLTFPLGFVAGVATFLAPLLNGTGMWCFDAREEGIPALRAYLEDKRLTAYYSTPYLAKSLAESLPDGEKLEHLRFILTGGEAITAAGVAALRRVLPESAFYVNGAGSSETGGMIVAWTLPGDAPAPTGVIPAGRAAPNAEVLIVGDDGVELPQGEVGEIVFVSRGLSGGYWRDDERNAELFSVTDDGRRRYRSGDLGRLDDDGNLVMAGRADSAVKVRGYLVEPSEIEAALTGLDEIRDAVVIAQKSDEKPTRLLAYIVPTAGLRAPSTPAVRRALRQTLPEYMVPAEIVQLTALPRTERGKVDRQNLPPVPERVVSDDVLDQHEYVMAQIWCRVLEIPGLDADDDFMALGGDSLSAEELLAAVEDDLGVTLESSDILRFPTLAEFTKRVSNHASALPSDPDVVPLNTGTGGRPLFCIAGAGALALTYLPLARQFPERDVYAFQAHAMERRGLPDRTVTAHAERVIRTMRTVQPHGPYVVVGHSFGGFVALEVAHILRAGGEEVELVAILDTFARDEPGATPSTPSATVESAARPSSGLRGIAAAALDKQVRRILPYGLPEVDQVSRHVRAHLAGVVTHEGQRQFDAIADRSVLALRKHVIQPYDGPVLYVLAKTNDRGLSGWQDILTGDLRVEATETDHTSLLRDPEVQTLASILRKHLEPVGVA
ncbi:alpha/beta fold hydrolase [Frondihabitans cladoniiphilus]|uniref:Carrier domain-containing protein n=1 Tax=Frondihabitans cladoniiphilus TaxID=715785 RepID=A0ABP8VPQ0_9MICO